MLKIQKYKYINKGGDFDGTENIITNIEDVSKYPNLTDELIKRWYIYLYTYIIILK